MNWWITAYSFENAQDAVHAYERAAKEIEKSWPGANISVYRVSFAEHEGDPMLPVVTILAPEGNFDAALACSEHLTKRGKEIMLPVEVADKLAKRSLEKWRKHPGFSEHRNVNERVEFDD